MKFISFFLYTLTYFNLVKLYIRLHLKFIKHISYTPNSITKKEIKVKFQKLSNVYTTKLTIFLFY